MGDVLPLVVQRREEREDKGSSRCALNPDSRQKGELQMTTISQARSNPRTLSLFKGSLNCGATPRVVKQLSLRGMADIYTDLYTYICFVVTSCIVLC